MPKRSAGILMYRNEGEQRLVLLAHPGGPFWQRRDDGAWSIPKGELVGEESAAAAARREFEEELGIAVIGEIHSLGSIRQTGGKWVEAFALEGEFDVTTLRSNRFEIEWPPRSGKLQTFPEIDRVAWFSLEEARTKILAGQRPLLDRLEAWVGGAGRIADGSSAED